MLREAPFSADSDVGGQPDPRKRGCSVKRAFLSVLVALSLLFGSHAVSSADQLARTREAVRPEIEGDPDEPQATVPVHSAYLLDESTSKVMATRENNSPRLFLRLLRAVRLILWRSAW